MSRLGFAVGAAVYLLLSACGGGGSGVASASGAPTTTNTGGSSSGGTTTSPAPIQTYATDAVTSQSTINSSGFVANGSNTAERLTVSYDPNSQTYTVTAADRSQSFPTSAATTAPFGSVRYSAGSDLLTLYTTGYASKQTYRYVTLGTWQRSSVAGLVQATTFDLFAYGSASGAAALPRTGRGAYQIDLLALLSLPSNAGAVVTGAGSFNVDFLNANFALDVTASEQGIINADTKTGYRFLGGGRIGSDGTITGAVAYSSNGSSIGGPLAGRFYGPSGEELGATFAASNFDGAAITGAIIGQSSIAAAVVNTSLLDLRATQKVSIYGAGLTYSTITLNPDGGGAFDPDSPLVPHLSYGSADVVAGPNANFVYHANTNGTLAQTPPVNNVQYTFGVYKVGAANTELQLSYLNLAEIFYHGASTLTEGSVKNVRQYLFYGLETPVGALNKRTGTAHYDGVAYGIGILTGSDARYEIRGTSAVDVNFNAAKVNTTLALQATDIASGRSASIGTYTGSGTLVFYNTNFTLQLYQGTTLRGIADGHFYGPTGQEIGGKFTINVDLATGVDGTVFQGVFAAREK